MTDPGPGGSRRRRDLLLPVLLSILAPLCALALVEGFVSLGLVAYDLSAAVALRDPVGWTGYDSLLGWTSKPNLALPDAFGTGAALTTNAAGRRDPGRPEARGERGEVRLVCSGDSYTFGLGVGDEETWCAVLARLDSRLETYNLGEIAYGLDQSYLRFRRDGVALDGNIHVLAFIWDDFRRMRGTRFLGFDKPTLALEGGTLRPENVPVPRLSSDMPRLADWLYAAGAALRGLRTARVVARMQSASRSPDGEPAADPLAAVVERMLQEVDSIDRAHHARFVLVHLPTARDAATPEAAAWAERLPGIVERQNLDYLDLESDYRALSAEDREGLISPAHGHYSAAGHAWAAERILAHLRPALDSISSPRP